MSGGQEDVELSKATTLILALWLQAPHQSRLLQVLILRNPECHNSAEMDRSLKSSFFFPIFLFKVCCSLYILPALILLIITWNILPKIIQYTIYLRFSPSARYYHLLYTQGLAHGEFLLFILLEREFILK